MDFVCWRVVGKCCCHWELSLRYVGRTTANAVAQSMCPLDIPRSSFVWSRHVSKSWFPYTSSSQQSGWLSVELGRLRFIQFGECVAGVGQNSSSSTKVSQVFPCVACDICPIVFGYSCASPIEPIPHAAMPIACWWRDRGLIVVGVVAALFARRWCVIFEQASGVVNVTRCNASVRFTSIWFLSVWAIRSCAIWKECLELSDLFSGKVCVWMYVPVFLLSDVRRCDSHVPQSRMAGRLSNCTHRDFPLFMGIYWFWCQCVTCVRSFMYGRCQNIVDWIWFENTHDEGLISHPVNLIRTCWVCAFHMRNLSIQCASAGADCTLFCLLYRYFFFTFFFFEHSADTEFVNLLFRTVVSGAHSLVPDDSSISDRLWGRCVGFELWWIFCVVEW